MNSETVCNLCAAKDKHPEINSKWAHNNGNLYTVLYIANTEHPSLKFPPTVVYQGTNGSLWTRPVYDWNRSMTRYI